MAGIEPPDASSFKTRNGVFNHMCLLSVYCGPRRVVITGGFAVTGSILPVFTTGHAFMGMHLGLTPCLTH